MNSHTPLSTTESSTHTVLIVDDDIPVTRIIRKTLEHDNFECDSVHTLEDARATIQKKSFDVILLDLNLPDGNGFALPTFKDGKFRTPTIVLSGRTEPVDTIYALEIGAEDFIKKPFEPSELIARVKSTIRRHTANSDTPIPVLTNRRQPRVQIGTVVFDLEAQKFMPEHLEIERLDDIARTVLITLLSNNNRTVPKRELCAALGWDSTMINNRELTSAIARVKRSLFKLGAGRNNIKYVYRKGYHLHDG
jgi:DNA-binding response OmpR family regulator